MSNHVKIEITLRQDTFKRIEEVVNYNKFRKKFINKELSLSNEEIIKDAIMYYLKKIDQIHSHVVSEKALNLKGNRKLKNNFKQIMKDLNINQSQLAELANCNPSNVSIFVANRSQPSLEVFLRIWVAFGCPPIEDMFYREDSD